MILYNVTVKIEQKAHGEWLEWMQQVHIPEVMATGCFVDYRMAKLLFLEDEAEGPTYSIQYRCVDLATLQQYFDQHAPSLQAAHTGRYKDRFVAFRSIMETLDF